MHMTLVGFTVGGIIQCDESKIFPDTTSGNQAAESYFGELYAAKVLPEEQSKEDLISCLDEGCCRMETSPVDIISISQIQMEVA